MESSLVSRDRPLDILRIIFQYLPLPDLITLKVAYEVNSKQKQYLSEIFDGMTLPESTEILIDAQHITWLISQNVSPTNLRVRVLNDSAMRFLLKSAKLLKSLNFTDCISLTDSELSLFSHCPSLISLSLQTCSRVTDRGLEEFLAQNPQLKHLNLSLTNLTKNSISFIASHCPHLETLNLSGNPWFTDQLLSLLYGRQLRSLDLSATGVRLDQSISDLLTTCPTLDYISFMHSPSSFESYLLALRQVASRSLMSDEPELQALGLHSFWETISTGLTLSPFFFTAHRSQSI
jgi:hypothetical protein